MTVATKTDRNGIERYDFKDMNDYRKVYSQPKEDVKFPNINVETGEIATNGRWDLVMRFVDRFHLERPIDFGCGDGGLSFLLEKRGVRCDGVEIDPGVAEAVSEYAKKIGSKNRYYSSSIEDFKTNELYDSAFVLDVFEHFIDARAAMDSVERCVANGGIIIVATPNIDGAFGEKDDSKHHINLQSEESLKDFIGEDRIIKLFTVFDIIFALYIK